MVTKEVEMAVALPVKENPATLANSNTILSTHVQRPSVETGESRPLLRNAMTLTISMEMDATNYVRLSLAMSVNNLEHLAKRLAVEMVSLKAQRNVMMETQITLTIVIINAKLSLFVETMMLREMKNVILLDTDVIVIANLKRQHVTSLKVLVFVDDANVEALFLDVITVIMFLSN